MPLSQVLIPGEEWQLLGEGYTFTEGPAADRQGNVYFTDDRESRIYRIDAGGEITLFAENTARTNGLMFGPDGRLCGCRNGDRQIVAYDESPHSRAAPARVTGAAHFMMTFSAPAIATTSAASRIVMPSHLRRSRRNPSSAGERPTSALDRKNTATDRMIFTPIRP